MLKSSTLEVESLALKLSERDARVTKLRAQLQRMREERASALKKADATMQELEVLQDQYEQVVDDVAAITERKGRHGKEIRGLGKEIIWLRARLKREEKFRQDLAWSKGLMELGEQVRAVWYVLKGSFFCDFFLLLTFLTVMRPIYEWSLRWVLSLRDRRNFTMRDENSEPSSSW
jgi:chromosome segregation ATPase